MKKVKNFLKIWGVVIEIVVLLVLLTFSLYCDIFALKFNLLVGSLGFIGTSFALAGAGIILYSELREALANYKYKE